MPRPRNRFVHCRIKPAFDDQSKWAVKAGIRPEIIALPRFKLTLLQDAGLASTQLDLAGIALLASRSLLLPDEHDTYVVFSFGRGTYAAQSFNLRNRRYKGFRRGRQNGSQWLIPNRPTMEDWVLLVRKTYARHTIGFGTGKGRPVIWAEG